MLDKYLDTEVDGYQPIDQDTKLEGKDVFLDGVFYNPLAPTKATAGQKRSAESYVRLSTTAQATTVKYVGATFYCAQVAVCTATVSCFGWIRTPHSSGTSPGTSPAPRHCHITTLRIGFATVPKRAYKASPTADRYRDP